MTAALNRAEAVIYGRYTHTEVLAARLARDTLAAALADVEGIARALAPSVADYWCGDHIDEQYDALDEDTEELRCEDYKRARHEKAREAVGLVRAALLGTEAAR